MIYPYRGEAQYFESYEIFSNNVDILGQAILAIQGVNIPLQMQLTGILPVAIWTHLTSE